VCAKNSDGTETCVDGDQLKSLLGSAAAGDLSDVADAPEEAVTGGSSAPEEHADHPDADAPNVAEDGDHNETTSPQAIVPSSISASTTSTIANDNVPAASGGDHENDAQQEARESETQPDEITPPHVSTPLFEDDEETANTGAAAEPVPSGTPDPANDPPAEPRATGTE
jgi:hypothetical protein